MTPAARIAAAIDILDRIGAGDAAEPTLLRWSRASRFAGSGDRAAVRDLVFEALRRRNSLAAMGGGDSGRRLMIGMLRDRGTDPDSIFTGTGHAPASLQPEEREQPDPHSVMDIPSWMIPLWREALGPDAERIDALMGQRAPVWLRVNQARYSVDQAISLLSQDGIEVATDQRLDGALSVVSGERRIARGKAYLDGAVELQDLSPQLACARLPLRCGDRVLDYCAGGGGKALALAARHHGLSIDAHDADPARMGDLPARAARAGAEINLIKKMSDQYQMVVADVPCSGSGTWRRTPDAKWRLDRQGLDALLKIQRDIMNKVASMIAPDGYLAYMTCSFFEAENQQQIAGFLDGRDDFVHLADHVWTPLNASDGFFLSLLQRKA